MALFRCYDNSDVIKTLLMINSHLCLWQRSYSQNWEVLTLKNCHSIEPPSVPVWPTLLHRMALVSFLLFRKNLATCENFFGQMVYRPPWQKIARTPMYRAKWTWFSHFPNLCHKNSNLFSGSPVPAKHLVDVLSLSKSPAAYVTLISITTDMTH